MGRSVHLVSGSDEYRVSTKAGEVVSGILSPDEQLTALERVDAAVTTVDEAVRALGACRQALQTMGLFSERKVVWLRDATFLVGNNVGKSPRTRDALAELTALFKAGLPPDVTLLITAPAVDGRSAFYKAVKESGAVHVFDVPDKAYQVEQEARARLVEAAQRAGVALDDAAIDLFLARVGTGTRMIVNEIEKLAVYLGASQRATVEDVRAVTSTSRSAAYWDLADAVGGREPGRALEVARQLLFQKEPSLRLVRGIENRLRDLAVYQEAMRQGWLKDSGGRGGRAAWGQVPPDINALLKDDFDRDPRKTHPFRASVLAGQARRFRRRELQRALRAAVDAHTRMVSKSTPDQLVLELLLLRLA